MLIPPHSWQKKAQKALLAPLVSTTLEVEEQGVERNRAYDLLDSLTRSGCLPVDRASLHVVVGSTHCFEQTLIDTVIKDNINPIEKLERSTLIISHVVHGAQAVDMIKPEQVERVKTYSPTLFAAAPAAAVNPKPAAIAAATAAPTK